jgi:hypothetical protein
MGCEALPIEYYESLAEKGSSSPFLSAKLVYSETHNNNLELSM